MSSRRATLAAAPSENQGSTALRPTDQSNQFRNTPPESVPLGTYDITVHRNHAYRGLAATAGVVLIPFTINSFLQGRFLLGAATLAVIGVLSVNVFSMRGSRAPIIHPVPTLVPIWLALITGIYVLGYVGVFWAYPTIFFFYFALSRRWANFFSIILILAIAPITYVSLGPPASIRAVITLVLTSVFGNIFTVFVERLYNELQQMVITDPLTGAFNRRHLDLSIHIAVDRRNRYTAYASLISVDIDRFKNINDELGHETGDAALRNVVRIVNSRIRRLDDVFRTGGDEFTVLLPDTRVTQAQEIADTLRNLVAESSVIENRQLTISCGVAELAPSADAQEWLKECDKALYQAKALGRNRVVVAAPEGAADPTVG